MALRIPAKVQPVVDFAVQIVVGALAFVAVFLVAVLVAGFVRTVEHLGFAPAWLSTSADWVEKFIWGADLIGLALFLVSEILTFGRKLWKEWKA